jgi:hypothetical protein
VTDAFTFSFRTGRDFDHLLHVHVQAVVVDRDAVVEFELASLSQIEPNVYT